MKNEPLKTIIVGGGHRSLTYAALAEIESDKMVIVGVADPDDNRRSSIAKKFNIPPERCFKTAEELASAPKFADAVINGTMDHIHVKTSISLLKAGYDILLEKPFAVNEDEARELVAAANKYGRKIMVCFVLRYAPFYRKIKDIILSGEIGKIISIQTNEYVSYHHMSTSHVRGKWNNFEKCHSSMLLAKCCHDLDIMMWLMSETKPALVSSFGCNMQFRPENAPENSGTRCLVDCPLSEECLYSAKRLYIDHPDRWSFYVWDALEHNENTTIEDKIELLKTSPYGICAYKSDNNVVDHQTVNIFFENGATGTHNMIGGTSRGTRTIFITGTRGTIEGDFENGIFTLSKIDPRPGCEHNDTVFDLKIDNDTHGGGDLDLVRDFVAYVRGETPSVSCTSINDSMLGHLVVFLADKSRDNDGIPQKVIL
ncbi:MAG: Gfo/Idh/MocA family oxidoreductase [Ruminococcaceae bacterium]|nr:Gfo/Idh/MocA family oxidoreductase [Oscillospiraceae bacterium]